MTILLSAVARFMVTMAEVLESNDHKSGWQSLSPQHCLHRARQELAELQRAVDGGDWRAIQHEAADMAAFLMFLSENVRPEKDT